jgi:hypothetical protein
METITHHPLSVFGLFRSLTGDARTLLRQELKLARVEVTENLSRVGKQAATLAVGGIVAYAGLLVLLVGLGWLVGWAFRYAGLSPAFSIFLGMTVIGLLVCGAGAGLLLAGFSRLSKESLAPQRTIHTLQELKAGVQKSEVHKPSPPASSTPPDKPSSQEMQARVEATEERLEETIGDLSYRLSPQNIKAQVKGRMNRVKGRIQERPYNAGLLAVAAGVLSGILVGSRSRRHSR